MGMSFAGELAPFQTDVDLRIGFHRPLIRGRFPADNKSRPSKRPLGIGAAASLIPADRAGCRSSLHGLADVAQMEFVVLALLD
jgi:hypothetical protein